MKTVHFHGAFAEMAQVGEHKLAVTTPLDLFNALSSQLKGFREYASKNQIVVVAANEDLSTAKVVKQNALEDQFGELEHIHIAPAVEGSGIEAALIAAGYTAFAAAAITIVANIAISFVVSAVVKALSPSPDSSDGPAEAAKKPSFLYNGPKLVTDQGYPIPLIWGTHMHGGFNIGTDIEVQDIPYEASVAPASSGPLPVLFAARGEEIPREDYQW